jgi:phage head maturation protease
MVGYFSVTGRDTWSEIRSKREGHFLERVAPGAYRRTFAEDEIVPMFSHGHDPMFSERPLGVVRLLEEDTVGARFAVDLYDVPSIRELLPGLATNAYGSSYRFSVRDESWTPRPGKSFHNPTGLPERIIRDARVLEFGPTVFPAQKRTSAGLAQPGDPPAMQAASARIPAPRAARRPSASVPRAWRRTVPSSWR